jgi:peptidoglycan hydrolase-like protein with peptidoglycan-binding domain
MRLRRLALFSAMIAAPVLAVAMPHARRGPTSPKLFSKRAAKPKPVPQHAIDSERATQIQAALIKSGYLAGPATGEWNAQTQAALVKLQGDNGWQTKLVPDARAIIKLGLGPNSAVSAASETGPLPGSTDVSGQ